MRARSILCAVLLVALLAPGLIATSSDHVRRSRQSAVAFLVEPTLIGSVVIEGPVLFVHDDEKMARGEPCTSIRRFDPARGPAEEVASFHCIPTPRAIVSGFTLRTRPNRSLGFGCVLVEYQFAGDSEAHGVPIAGNAH